MPRWPGPQLDIPPPDGVDHVSLSHDPCTFLAHPHHHSPPGSEACHIKVIQHSPLVTHKMLRPVHNQLVFYITRNILHRSILLFNFFIIHTFLYFN